MEHKSQELLQLWPPLPVAPKLQLAWWKEKRMLRWVWLFLILAIIAAIFGFAGIVTAAAGIAKVLFFIFLVIFVIGLIMGRRAAV